MRAAPPTAVPDGHAAGRPRGRALLLALAVALLALVGAAAPAAAQSAAGEPRMPQPVLLINDCDATLSVVDLVPGRVYDIVVTDDSESPVFSAKGLVASAEVLDDFVTVPAGIHHWTVVDKAAPRYSVERTIEVSPCAAVATAATTAAIGPAVTIQLLACDLLGASDIAVSVSGLSSGAYTASVTADGMPVPGVADATVTAAANSVILADLPNGGTYVVAVADSSGGTVASASTTLPICDLPTLGEDPLVEEELPTTPGLAEGGEAEPTALAPTGLPVAGALLIGLGAFQVGALAAAVGVVRRRPARQH